MNYQNSKGVVSIVILAAVAIAGVVLVDYLSRINERISRLEQANPATALLSSAETANGGNTGAQGIAGGIKADEESAGEVIVPDDSVMVSGKVIKVEKDAITITMMPGGEDYDFVALVNESTSVNKQKDPADQNAVPAEISEIKVGDFAVIESAGQIGDDKKFTARKINFFEMPEDQPQN
ncbi:MAG TPA: hypothetical protein PLA19_05050 [Candidatus Pacearchaeota archaeon]|nr:hypothetical protein [Candidatus Pacearchaeota archaeon]